jgi:DHA3 family tetracycline resistance protein-like MFS transporter
MLFKEGELKILWGFYACYFLLGLSAIIAPYMIIYFQKLGFSFAQIGILTVATGLGVFLFEVPTGVYADAVSRKYSVLIGFIIAGISVLLIPVYHSFFMIMLLLFLMGVGLSFVSGAEEAWVIDNLHFLKRKDLQNEYFIKSMVMSSAGFILVPFIGVYIIKNLSYDWLWYVFGLAMVLSVLILFFVSEHYVPKKKNFKTVMRQYFAGIRKGFHVIKKNRSLYLIILGTMVIILMNLGVNGFQPLLVQFTLPEYALGYVYGVLAAFSIVAAFMSRLFQKYRLRTVIVVGLILRILFLVAIAFVYPPLYWLVALFFILSNNITTGLDPLLSTFFHNNTPKKLRATVVSIKSMLFTAMSTVVGIIGGVLMDIFPLKSVIALGGILGIFGIAVYMQLREN